MKTGFLVVLLLLMGATLHAAETLYVSEEFEVTFRSGPGNDRKILAMVPAGRVVELINKGEEWSEVRLPSGKEGWILTRYLTDKMPSALQLARLESRHTEMLAQNKEFQKKVSDLAAENRALSAQLKQTQETLAAAEANYEGLKNDSSDFMKFKADYEKNRKELIEIRGKAEKAESQLNRLASSQLYEGMIYGGGLIVFGFLAGYILKRPKRRSPLM